MDDIRDSHGGARESLRRAMIDAALAAYDDAGLSGLCAEGRWEAAVDAMRHLDLAAAGTPAIELDAGIARAVEAVARAPAPPPSGGSVAAAAGALSAALTQMVAGLTAGRPKYADVAADMQAIAQRCASLASELLTFVGRDAAAVDAVAAAYRLPNATEQERSRRADAIEHTMRSATDAPLDIARASASVADLAATVAERGNTNAVADAAVAALLADAVCRAAALTVRVNAPALRDAATARDLEREASGLASVAAGAAARAAAVVEQVAGPSRDGT